MLQTPPGVLLCAGKAWIELAYAKSIARDNPAEARKVYNEVKERTPPSSPLWPQLKAMEKTFQ